MMPNVEGMYANPWIGALPLEQLRLEDSLAFVRRDDGVWRREDTKLRIYIVSRRGERIAQPKVRWILLKPIIHR